MSRKYDVAIIGCGPAGLSAALYVRRANLTCIVIGKDYGSLTKAESIENYFGLEDSISGIKLVENGISQAKALGAEIISDEVFGITWDESYKISCADGDYFSCSVIIATGSARKSAGIDNISEFEGRGVSYCAVCDAFFHRGKDVAVLGSNAYALHEIGELINIANSVTLLTNGQEPEITLPNGVTVITEKIKHLLGEDKFEGVEFESGHTEKFSGLFIALGSAAASDLARKVGAPLNGDNIIVDENMSTALPGLYAAGDCTGGVMQVSVAVGEGAKAAMSAIKFVRSQKGGD